MCPLFSKPSCTFALYARYTAQRAMYLLQVKHLRVIVTLSTLLVQTKYRLPASPPQHDPTDGTSAYIDQIYSVHLSSSPTNSWSLLSSNLAPTAYFSILIIFFPRHILGITSEQSTCTFVCGASPTHSVHQFKNSARNGNIISMNF